MADNEAKAKLAGAIGLIVLFLIGAPSMLGAARMVIVPLKIDYLTLAAELKSTIFTRSDGRARVWKGSDACQFLDVTNPRFLKAESGLILELDGKLSLGLAVAGRCLSPFAWNGIMDLNVQPFIAPNLTLKLRVTDINLYDRHHQRTLIASHGFNLVKGNVIPRMETFEFNLKSPLDQLAELALLGAAPEVAQRVKAAADTLVPIPPVKAEQDAIRLALQMTLPAAEPTATASVSAGPLTAEETANWHTALDQWDAFIVFAIEQVGESVGDPDMRERLFDLLMDSRYRLIQALAEPEPAGPDPVRILFLDTWSQLGDIIRSAARHQLLGNRELEFLTFVSAGDALFALDEAAPALGVRISAADLRRLARIMAPRVTADPLIFNFDEDPALRKMFNLVQPLALPDSTQSLAAETPGPRPTASPATAAPPIANPPAAPSSSPSPQPVASPTALEALRTWWIFGASRADAADIGPDAEILRLGEKLKRVVADDSNVSTYQPEVESLLRLTAQHDMAPAGLGVANRRTYLLLVKTTAWQESCWRQFVRRGNRVEYLESSTGDIGLMQINKYVWRGFYSLARLEWDIVYNAGAGSAILLKLLTRAIAKDPAGRMNAAAALARSSYSAYNGGSASLNRWRETKVPARIKKIDRAFWAKYQAMAINRSFDIQTCAAQWAGTH